MKGWFAHRDAADVGQFDDQLPSLPHVLADRACCCPARPVVTVMIPPAPGGPHSVDLLLLCGHHFRVSQAALTAAGAAVYDDTGALVAGGVSEYEHDRASTLLRYNGADLLSRLSAATGSALPPAR
jgi:hypothetical protein